MIIIKKNGQPQPDSQKENLNHYKQEANLCKRRKTTYGLVFSSLIIDIVLGLYVVYRDYCTILILENIV